MSTEPPNSESVHESAAVSTLPDNDRPKKVEASENNASYVITVGPVVVSAVCGWRSAPEATPFRQCGDTSEDASQFGVSLEDSDDTSVETIAVGSLESRTFFVADDAGESISMTTLAVGGTWIYPLRRRARVLFDQNVFLLPTRSASDVFVLALPPNATIEMSAALQAAMTVAGCILTQGKMPPNAEGATYLGRESDACSSEAIVVIGVSVTKGASECIPVTLDERGYFYWEGSKVKKDRTRPKWRETNCVVCQRAETGRRIIWECYNVPSWGEEPGVVKAALEANRRDAAAASAALWAARRESAGRVTAVGLKTVATASPYVASGVKLVAEVAAGTISFGGDVARATIPQTESGPLEVDPDLQRLVSTTKDVSQAGVAVCNGLRESVEVGAKMAGAQIGRKIAVANSQSAPESEATDTSIDAGRAQFLPEDVQSDLASAGSAAASGVGQILDEMNKARTLLKQHTAEAACAVVGARYGAQAENTLGDALATVGVAGELREGAQNLTRRRVAATAAVHCALGAGDAASSAAGDGDRTTTQQTDTGAITVAALTDPDVQVPCS